MTDLGLLLIEAAFRTTLLALAAAGLYRVAAGRTRGQAASILLSGLLGCAALTLLAVCPLPAWWTWTTAPPLSAPDALIEGTADAVAPTGAEVGGPGWSLAALAPAWRSGTASAGPPAWPAWLAGAFLLGAGLGLVRLLAGCWAVGRLRRRSRPVTDGPALALFEAVRRATGCPAGVALCETAELSTPATAGWLRPVVFLPAGWPDWDAADLRAALAHELAHVARGDFLTGLLARLCVALHFYHPLVRWLAARLRLHQELAADADAAAVVGGRGIYLRALARLALRQDDAAPAWPARAMLDGTETLSRRIAMLQVKDDGRDTGTGRLGRLAAVGLLAAAVVALSAVRGPAEDVAPAGRAPFDLAWLPDDAMGVVACRPGETLRRPALKRFAATIDAAFAALVKVNEIPAEHLLPIADVEQAVGTLALVTDPNRKDAQSEMVMTLSLLRASRDFDWKRLVDGLHPDAKPFRHAGRVYYKFDVGTGPRDAVRASLLGPRGCFYFPDARTVVFQPTEEQMKRALERQAGEPPTRPWAAAWQKAERSATAVAMDNSRGQWTRAFEARTRPEEEARPYYRHLSWAVWTVDDRDGLVGTAEGECRTAAGAEELVGVVTKGLADARAYLARPAVAEPKTAAATAELRLARDVLENVRVERAGKRLSMRFATKGDFDALLVALLGEAGS